METYEYIWRNGQVNVYAVTPEGEKIAHSFRLTPKSK